ncbi:putative trep [Treponema primitia ZAS-2]|uniref:Putative trep n=1 Tax=Treponema primitia (strain ATCC BAA-887 / DSM 12427 / ZAS-2) TaxID=545694 RepID=F5YJL4_TREPZ|nr:hypothetical protein [Treponema primitia]AEF85963.1 putative trep [Treponema primitia ZAS-2]
MSSIKASFLFFLLSVTLIGMNRARFLFVLLLATSLEMPGAQTLKPFTGLRVIRTEHFDIIYPRESEPTARALAGMADGIYDRVSGLLGISLKRRTPVTITPHTEKFNGYMNPLPYPHIVLYDTSMSIEWTVFENSLESLFLHELTHAVSLSSRDPSVEILSAIFGGWVYPTGLTAPMFMVEGVTVNFESLSGFGRANDPLIQQRLRQAIHEDAFLSPFQTAGVYKYPHTTSAHYEYGGLFSAWLCRTYGMEKYAALWKAIGREYHFSFFFYNNGFFNSFKNVYGLTFLEAWGTFKESLRLTTIEENPISPVYTGYTSGPLPFPRQGAIINAVSSGEGKVFFLDNLAQGAFAYDTESGKTRRVIALDSIAYGLDAREDGESFLVSTYRYKGSLARAMVIEYGRKGLQTGHAWPGLYSGRYFRDGVIGLSSELHNNKLVFRSELSGKLFNRKTGEQVLLEGNEELLFGSPVALDDTWIAFIAARKGKRELCLYNFDTRQVYTLGSDLPDDEERWRYIRSLQVSQGKLFFTFNHDRGMYKLGAVDISRIQDGGFPETLDAVFTERNLSGAVAYPVMAGDSIYYAGTFAQWDALMRYPDPAPALSGLRTTLALKPWPAEASIPLTELWPADIPTEVLQAEAKLPPSRGYLGISYLNPLKLWLPLPLIRPEEGSNLSVDGVGIFSFMSDPTDTNLVFLTAFYDIRSPMAAGELQWISYALGFPLIFNLSDDLNKTLTSNYRETRTGISAALSTGLGNERLRFEISPNLDLLFAAPRYTRDSWGQKIDGGDNPYSWDYDQFYYSAGLRMRISNLTLHNWELFGQGLSLTAYGRLQLDRPLDIPRLDGLLTAALEPILPLRLHLYGAWDRDGFNLRGESRYYQNTPFASIALSEYPVQNQIVLEWLAGAEAEMKLFSFDIQRNLSHAYFNRVYGTLAWRGGFYDDQGKAGAEGNYVYDAGTGSYRLAQSLVMRLGFTISTILVTALPVSIDPSVWGAWKISNVNDNINNDFVMGMGFSFSY